MQIKTKQNKTRTHKHTQRHVHSTFLICTSIPTHQLAYMLLILAVFKILTCLNYYSFHHFCLQLGLLHEHITTPKFSIHLYHIYCYSKRSLYTRKLAKSSSKCDRFAMPYIFAIDSDGPACLVAKGNVENSPILREVNSFSRKHGITHALNLTPSCLKYKFVDKSYRNK